MEQIKYHKVLKSGENGHKEGYILDEDYTYYSKRYNRTKTIKEGRWSDGATGFVDLGSDNWLSRLFAWVRNRIHHLKGNAKTGWFFIHDAFCEDGEWDDGTVADRFTASTVAADMLWDANYKILSVPVWWATFLFGGKDLKKWIRYKEKANGQQTEEKVNEHL